MAGLRRFAEPVLAASRHPVLLYHIPEFAPPVPPGLVADMPVWGVKDSGGDLGYTRAVLATGKQVMVGIESTVVEAVTAGARGTIAGLANVLPEPMLAACAAAAGGRAADGHQMLAPALAFRDELLAAGPPLGWVSIMKRLAEERHGIPARRRPRAAARGGRRGPAAVAARPAGPAGTGQLMKAEQVTEADAEPGEGSVWSPSWGGHGTVQGAYSPYFWVESDRAMAGGREFHGQPKRIADVALETPLYRRHGPRNHISGLAVTVLAAAFTLTCPELRSCHPARESQARS